MTTKTRGSLNQPKAAKPCVDITCFIRMHRFANRLCGTRESIVNERFSFR